MSTTVASGWRRQGLWLLGAAVLAAWAVIGPYLKDRQDFRLWHPSLPRVVPAGEWRHYQGARWRLRALEVLDARSLNRNAGDNIALRPDSQALLATLEVIADAGTRGDKLDSCKSVVRDRHDRSWDAQPLTLFRYRGTDGTSCGTRLGADFKRVEAQPGRIFRFAQIFQVPRDVPLSQLRVELSLPVLDHEPRGTFLRFEPPSD